MAARLGDPPQIRAQELGGEIRSIRPGQREELRVHATEPEIFQASQRLENRALEAGAQVDLATGAVAESQPDDVPLQEARFDHLRNDGHGVSRQGWNADQRHLIPCQAPAVGQLRLVLPTPCLDASFDMWRQVSPDRAAVDRHGREAGLE